jgi:cell division protein FtsI (penicillin-binding protein 3)
MEAAAPTVTAEVAVADGTITSGDEGLMMPNFMGMSMRMVMRSMENRGLNVKLIGSGRAVEQNPQPGQLIRSSDQVWVKFAAAI